MKILGLFLLALAGWSSWAFSSGAHRAATESRTPLTGDYVEARTASVFAGACHYNGERQTTGRDAVLAWSFASGTWRGVDVSGGRVLAIVNADANLADADATRHSEIVVDAANDAQADALLDAMKENYVSVLGRVVQVRRAAVNFEHDKEGAYRVETAGVAGLAVAAMPDKGCCRMPHLVWYEPFAKIEGRRVGFVEKSFYEGGASGEAWQRQSENSAFYGTFAF